MNSSRIHDSSRILSHSSPAELEVCDGIAVTEGIAGSVFQVYTRSDDATLSKVARMHQRVAIPFLSSVYKLYTRVIRDRDACRTFCRTGLYT